MNMLDPYKVLQVDPEAEDEVIEAAYRRLARKYHPDVSPSRESLERMVQLNQAWELLKNPARRASVDRARTRTQGSAARVSVADAQARTAGYTPATAHRPGPAGPEARRSPEQHARPRDTIGTDSAFPGVNDPMTGTSRAQGAAAHTPPGNPSGSVLNFGRYAGWSLGEIGRYDLEYLEWLDRMPIGRGYQPEIDAILRAHGRRAPVAVTRPRGGIFRRRR